MALVVLVEDDAPIRAAVTAGLVDRGHAVLAEATGFGGLGRMTDAATDVVVLDLGLPDIDGLDLLRMVRSVSDVPIIVATARGEQTDLIATLDAGADDYLIKPFTADELDARIRAVLRRVTDVTDRRRPIVVGGLVIDPRTRKVSVDGAPVDLTRKEFDLLHHLARRVGDVVTKRELLVEVWNQPWGGGDKTVDVHLSWLRRKLGETAACPRFIRSVRGVGVRLVPPGEG